MKISVIKNEGLIYTLKYTPSRFARFFGKKRYTKKWKKDPTRVFKFFDGHVYYDQEGNKISVFSKEIEAINKYEKSWEE